MTRHTPVENDQKGAPLLGLAAPGRLVLLYDGHCVLCLAARDRLVRWDHQGLLDCHSFRDPGVLDAFPQVREAAALLSMQVIDDTGRVFEEEGAVARLLEALGGALRVVAWVVKLPGIRWVARGVYRLVAANRFKLLGKVECSDACVRPLPVQRRFSGEGGPDSASRDAT